MRRALVSFLVLASICAAGRAEESSGDEYAFVEVTSPRTEYFVGEPVRLTLRFGFDAEYFRTNAIQTSRQRLDVPVRIDAAFVRGLPGVLEPARLEDEPAASRITFALNDIAADAPRAADVVRDGRTFNILEVQRRFIAKRAGDADVAAPVLHFAHASRFEDDLVNGRVPLDRRDAIVSGKPLALTVRPLPEESRPASFGGAIGRFTVRANTPRGEVKAGENFPLTLVIEGEGNLETFDPPRLDALTGFHVYGVLDDRGVARRTITYDIAALNPSVREIPAIALDVFDTTPPGAYRTLRTEAIPLVVVSEVGVDYISMPIVPASGPPVPPAPSSGPSRMILIVAIATAIVAALVFAQRRRAAASVQPDAATARSNAASTAFREQSVAPGADLANALANYIAARLDCPPAAVIAPNLAERLTASGVPSELSGRTAALLEKLVAARYGGSVSAQDSAGVRGLVEELDRIAIERAS